MYFWRIDPLKSQLREGPMSQRAAFAYVVATILLYTITTAVPGLWSATSESATLLDWLSYAIMIILVGGGTYAAYRANGGDLGSDFASRYFAIGWVLFIRLAAMLLVPAIMLVFVTGAVISLFSLEGGDGVFDWGGMAFAALFEAVYYWRMVHHFRQVGAGVGDVSV